MDSPTKSKKEADYHRCWFAGCGRNRIRYPTLHFFTFPTKRLEICEQWVKNCANESLKSIPQNKLKKRYVCEFHFTDDCFTNEKKNRLLRSFAVPTITSIYDDDLGLDQNVNNTPSKTIAPSTATTTPPPSSEQWSQRALFRTSGLSQATADSLPRTPLYKKFKNIEERKQTPGKNTHRENLLLLKLKKLVQQKRKYQQALRRAQVQKTKMSKKDLLEGMKYYFPENVFSLFAMQLNHTDQKNRPYSTKEKQRVLSIWYTSPAMYDRMRQDEFALPSPATIARWIQVQPPPVPVAKKDEPKQRIYSNAIENNAWLTKVLETTEKTWEDGRVQKEKELTDLRHWEEKLVEKQSAALSKSNEEFLNGLKGIVELFKKS